jgi:hypothetical protein
MKLTKKRVESLLGIGEKVYTRAGKRVVDATIIFICDDALETDVDTLFFDEHGENWWFTRIEAEKITRKSQKNVL